MSITSKASNPTQIVNQFSQTSLNELQVIQSYYRLNGKNYLIWSQVIRKKLKGKGKLSHLTGPIPSKDDPKCETWDVEDSLVISWLWDSMQPEISGNCMFFTTTKDIWDTVKQTYSEVKDAALVFEIKTKIHSTKQDTMSVTEYYNIMNGLWLELDYYQNLKMKCGDAAAMMMKFVEGERLYEFLTGLNMEFDQGRVQVLRKEEVPSSSEVFSIFRAEQGRWTVMLDSPPVDASVLVATRKPSSNIFGVPKQNQESREPLENKGDRWCDFCKRRGHTRGTRWKLNGKPSSFGRNSKQQRYIPRSSRVNIVIQDEDSTNNEPETNTLNKEEI